MRTVVCGALWVVLVLHLLLAEGWLRGAAPGSVEWAIPDVTLALVLFLAWFGKTGSLPFLLVTLAACRGLLLGESLFTEMLVLGLPVAALLPLRGVVFRRAYGWQCIAAGVLAWMTPWLSRTVHGLAMKLQGAAAASPELSASIARGWMPFLAVIATAPAVVFLLRHLPPGSQFTEGGE